MYESFYGLNERPFELTPNPRYLCRMPRYREALANLQYAITTGRGLTLLLGEAGTGKTTLLRTALKAQDGSEALCVSINNPTLDRHEFLRTLAEGFQLSSEAASSKPVFLRELEALLHARRARAAVTALVIDEAQSLSHELLEEVRLLNGAGHCPLENAAGTFIGDLSDRSMTARRVCRYRLAQTIVRFAT